jgi:hypothetical protein
MEMLKLVTEILKGVPTYTIVDGDGNKVAGAHRVNKNLDMYSLVIEGVRRPPVLRKRPQMFDLMNAMIEGANTSH